MSFLTWADARTRRLDAVDLGLVKWACIAAGILAAQAVPAVRKLDSRLVVAAVIGLSIKPAISAMSGRR